MSTALTTTQTSAAASGFALLMSPATIEAAREFCNTLAKTDFVPKAFRGKPDSIMVVGAMGARLGVDVFTAMAGIADINGKPAIFGDLMLAVCQNHHAFVDCVETFEGTAYEDGFRAVCVTKRKGREPVIRSFSVIEAKEAQLWKKVGPWTSTPQRMLQMRARAFALRDTFSDALAGFHAREEMEDLVDVTATATVHPEPRPAAVRVIPADDAPADHPESPIPESPIPEKMFAPESEQTSAVRDVSVTECQRVVGVMWKAGADAKAVAKKILADWKLAQVADLSGCSDEDRGAFLDQIAAAAKGQGVKL